MIGMLLFAGLGKVQLKKNQKEEKEKNATGNRSRNHMVPWGAKLFECHGYGLQVSKYAVCVYRTISFIFIPWIGTGLQNPYGCGNSHICLRSQEVKSV